MLRYSKFIEQQNISRRQKTVQLRQSKKCRAEEVRIDMNQFSVCIIILIQKRNQRFLEQSFVEAGTLIMNVQTFAGVSHGTFFKSAPFFRKSLEGIKAKEPRRSMSVLLEPPPK